MKICPQCNTQNKDTAQFCSSCRANLVAATASAPLAPGTLLERGRYQIDRELGRGGFGAVYLAQDTRLKRACVVKHLLIPPGSSRQEIDDLRRTFETEADSLASLNQPGHPNIPEIFDFFWDAAGNYLVMKYIEGETLEQQRARLGGGRPWKEMVEFTIQVADALVYMHSRKPDPVLHRDIKPTNILVDTTRRVWLVDFGLSKAQPTTGGTVGLSEAMGTPGYAPPEQYQKQTIPRSDVYALAATLYHLVSGDDPADHPFRFPQLKALPARLRRIVAQALQTEPGKRPTSLQWKANLEQLVRPAVSVQPLTFLQNEVATDLSSLADCCARHWDYARRILYDGTVENWLRTALHDPVTADKVQAIVKSQKDQDVALDSFIREINLAFPPPRLEVNPDRLDAGSVPWQKRRQLTFDIRNIGRGCLSGQVLSSASWLSVAPAEFSCVAGRRVRVTATVDARQLDPGQSYQAALTIKAGPGGQAGVPVTVIVPAPQLAVHPQRLNLGSAYQGETLSKTFTVSNTGGSAFEGQVSCGEPWANVEPVIFRVEPGGSRQVTVTAKTSGLRAGSRAAQIRIGASAGAWTGKSTVLAKINLPWVKTLWHRWATTLDWAAASVLTVLMLFGGVRILAKSQVHLLYLVYSSLSDPEGFWVWLVVVLVGGGLGWLAASHRQVAIEKPWGILIGALVLVSGYGLGAIADLGLGLAPAVALAVLAGVVLGGVWGLAARSERRQWSGILAIATLILALGGLGYLSAQPRYWGTCYSRGLAFRRAGEWDQAIAEFERCSTYRDAPEKILDVHYQAGSAYLAAHQWDQAIAEFEQCGAYKDAHTMVHEVYYRQAMAAIEAGQWDTAANVIIQLYNRTPNYKDIPDLIAVNPELHQALKTYGFWPPSGRWAGTVQQKIQVCGLVACSSRTISYHDL